MSTYIDMGTNNLYILINYDNFQELFYDPVPQVSFYCLLSNVSVNSDDNNAIPPLFHAESLPYENIILDADIFYYREL